MKNKEGWTVDANGNNKSGFNGLPGGCRHKSGRFYSLGNASGWWTSTESSAVSALFRTLGEQNVGRGDEFKENGFSVRCIKD